MGSTRLPGKPLLRLGDRTALETLAASLDRCVSLDAVVLATSTLPENDALEHEANRIGIPIFRGDEQDLVGRLWNAARAHEAGVIARITADDALMDPRVVDYMVDTFHQSRPDCATSLPTRSFPNGFVLSVFDTQSLGRMTRLPLTPFEREHVVPAFLSRRSDFTIVDVRAPNHWAGYEVGATLDTPDDLQLVRDVIEHFHGKPPALEALLDLFHRPEWSARAARAGEYWN